MIHLMWLQLFQDSRTISFNPILANTIFIFLNRVAILPLLNHSFCLNDSKRLRGFDCLQERHLSLLGYDVIQICYREWNSIHMNLPGARRNLLRKFLYKYE